MTINSQNSLRFRRFIPEIEPISEFRLQPNTSITVSNRGFRGVRACVSRRTAASKQRTAFLRFFDDFETAWFCSTLAFIFPFIVSVLFIRLTLHSICALYFGYHWENEVSESFHADALLLLSLNSFCCRKVYVLYGSQTGNAESIAKELSENLGRELISNELLALNKAKGRKLQDDCLLFLVVCSTTGNGDCPENADSWWRTVKLRSAVSVAPL